MHGSMAVFSGDAGLYRRLRMGGQRAGITTSCHGTARPPNAGTLSVPAALPGSGMRSAQRLDPRHTFPDASFVRTRTGRRGNHRAHGKAAYLCGHRCRISMTPGNQWRLKNGIHCCCRTCTWDAGAAETKSYIDELVNAMARQNGHPADVDSHHPGIVAVDRTSNDQLSTQPSLPSRTCTWFTAAEPWDRASVPELAKQARF